MLITVRPGCNRINPSKGKKTKTFKSGITQTDWSIQTEGKMTEIGTVLYGVRKIRRDRKGLFPKPLYSGIRII